MDTYLLHVFLYFFQQIFAFNLSAVTPFLYAVTVDYECRNRLYISFSGFRLILVNVILIEWYAVLEL